MLTHIVRTAIAAAMLGSAAIFGAAAVLGAGPLTNKQLHTPASQAAAVTDLSAQRGGVAAGVAVAASAAAAVAPVLASEAVVAHVSAFRAVEARVSACAVAALVSALRRAA